MPKIVLFWYSLFCIFQALIAFSLNSHKEPVKQKMIYKADPNYARLLLALPESGMGYQIIEATRAGNSFKEQFVVYNSELIIDRDRRFQAYKIQLFSEGYTRIFNKADTIQLSTPILVERSLFLETRSLSDSKRKDKGRNSGGSGAVQNQKEYADGVTTYVRLSAYELDHRVDFSKKRFLPGTYATTLIDYNICKNTNDDPIDRYAIPNNEPISWAFHVKPVKTDQLQKGIVQPANNHDGGGVEIYFVDGTFVNTYFQKSFY